MEDPMDKHTTLNNQLFGGDNTTMTTTIDVTFSDNPADNSNDQPYLDDQEQQLYNEGSSSFEKLGDINDKEDLKPESTFQDTELSDKIVPEEGKQDGDETLGNNPTQSLTKDTNDKTSSTLDVPVEGGNNSSIVKVNNSNGMEQGTYLHSASNVDSDPSVYTPSNNDDIAFSYGTIGNSTQISKTSTSTSIGIVYVNELEMIDFSSWLLGAICVLILLRLPYIKRFFMNLSTNQEPESTSELPYHSVPTKELD